MTADVPPQHPALAAFAGARDRILDEHMYRPRPPYAGWQVTFRLQLFTAPGLRPVAIATQRPGEGDGGSLTNTAERCAGAVWEQFFPQAVQPPIWIAHMILGGWRELSMVTFTADPAEHTLSCPEWDILSPADVDALVGRPVDLERGSGFQPPQVKPEPESAWRAYPVVLLPRPTPFRQVGCMAAGVPWWRRLGRQVVPRLKARGCCWYHGGNWHLVNRLAIRLTAQAQAAGVSFDDTPSYVLRHPDVQSLTGWEAEALEALMVDTIRPYAPWPRREGYNNGNHRSQAMLDAGVRRVLIERVPH
jgi:hypothetical protein